MSDEFTNSEIGREFSVGELTPGQVVVIAPPGRRERITIWVESVDPEMVVFFAGALNIHVINFIKDGQIFDERGRVVRVFEYLGEV